MSGKLRELAEMLKGAHQAHSEMAKVQKRLAKIEVHGTAGGGMVTATTDCTGHLRAVKIDPALLSEKPEVIEDLVVAAVSDAHGKAAVRLRQEMSNASDLMK